MKGLGRIGGTVGWVLLCGVLVGCRTPVRRPGEAGRTAVYQRADQEFARAVLLKPSTRLPEDNPMVRMAPLIFRETTGTNPAAVQRSGTVVYHHRGSATVQGLRLTQLTYWWWPEFGRAPSRRGAECQGIRVTLNTSEEPVIWEVLRDTTGVAVVFAARSLEAAAAREFGPALPGRRQVLEPEVSSAPDLVVGRVVDDGPVPMGPVVHLRAGTGDVGAVTCRCATPLVKDLAGEAEYDLVSVESERGLPVGLRRQGRPEPWTRLRLPTSGWDGERAARIEPTPRRSP